MSERDVEVLAFDVFGTVVDWHGSLCREVEKLGLDVPVAEFVTAWRDGYQPAMQRVRSGELGWTKIDVLHRIILDDIVTDFGVELAEDELVDLNLACLLYTSPSPRDGLLSRMPSSA